MPKDREYSKTEVMTALKVFKRFLEDHDIVILADEFLEWCDEKTKEVKDGCQK